MNRIDRLYALVEELRAVSPRPRSSHWLAHRFSVTERTIRRDVDALQQTGVPIYAEVGRRGGYVVDKSHTLPPINITAREAVAAAIALDALTGTPFVDAARSALCKLVAAMAKRDVDAAHALAGRIHVTADQPADTAPPAPRVLQVAEDAVIRRAVLTIDYIDRHGAESRRAVEPLGLLSAAQQWYLIGWCRLRGDVRDFRLDRVRGAETTREIAPERPIDPTEFTLFNVPIFRFNFPRNTDTMES